MKVRLWGTRGSIASASPETIGYGGNTACVEVRSDDGHVAILDAGTGIRRLGSELDDGAERIDLFLTHLHMDHIQGLGFFRPFRQRHREVHVWGPPSPTDDLRTRLSRYMSPPLFPVRLRDVAARLELHDVPMEPFQIGGLEVRGQVVIHPGQTIGYRISDGTATVAYIPDHEPALGVDGMPDDSEWTSGHDLAEGVDLLIHDAQYTADEYEARVGWGHSRISDAVALARLAGARRLVTFHHDPAHDDAELDAMVEQAREMAAGTVEVIPGREGATLRA